MSAHGHLHTALDYGRRGWAVFPVKPNDKVPMIADWPNQATTRVEQISTWWAKGSDANVGIVTGRKSGLVIIDIDARHDGGDSLNDLERKFGNLPETVEVLTGGGGRHLYFQYPPNGAVIRNSAGTLGLGLDVRGEGGFVVAPPSRHESGRTYEWEVSSHPDDVALALLPDWLLTLLQSPTQPKIAAVVGQDSSKIPEGQRNARLTSLAGTMRHRGMCEEAMTAALVAENTMRCQPPLPEDEVHQIVNSVSRYSPADDFQKDRHNDHSFPLEALPPILRQFSEELARSLPVAVDHVALATLVVAGSAMGNARKIQLKPGWTESPNLYAALVSPIGTLKSPVLKAVLHPVQEKQAILKDMYDEEVIQYEREVQQYQRDLKNFINSKKGSDPSGKPEPPVLARTWTGDTTVERLGVLLGENPRGMLLARDELTAWVKALNQYKGGRGSDRQFFLSGWNGADFVIDRQGKSPIFVTSPVLSVVGCIPPSVLPDLNDEGGREDGFLHRLLFTFPASIPVRWTEETVSETTRSSYGTLIQNLYALTSQADLPLSPNAQSLFIDWHDTHCREAEKADMAPGLKGFYAKLKGYCARLTLIHATCSDPQAKEASAESVGAAADLIDYFTSQAEKVLPHLRRDRPTPAERCEREILRHLANGQVLTKRELQRKGNADAKVFNGTLDALIDVGQIGQVQKPGHDGPIQGFKLQEGQE